MSISLWRRASGRLMIVLWMGWMGGAGGAAWAQVTWVHLAPDCPALAPEGTQTVDCGGAGSFVFGRPGMLYDGPCEVLAGGTEAPVLVPVEATPPLPPSFPCAQDDCLRHTPGHPWVAVLDWPTEHGWSVAATVREASDQKVDVQFYDLTQAGLASTWVTAVSDLHVLVQLCALAEDVHRYPGDRPLAVNMSFGRRVTASAITKPDPGLGSAIGRVLHHLTAEKGIVAVAAAGNYHEMLFPAASPDVVSAGAIDLSYFQQTQEIRPSTQTPPAAQALMQGYGLYLSVLAPTGQSSVWPAAPGSSYAAAIFAGWLGGTLAGDGKHPAPALPAGLSAGARWTPVTTADGLALALDGVPLPGSALNGPRLLLERALAAAPAARMPRADYTLQLTGALSPFSPLYPLLYAADGNGPQPGVDPCVPCRGGGPHGGMVENPDSVLLDLSSSGGLPPGMELLGVWLRVGKALYGFDGSRDPALLAALAAGSIEGLTLTGVGDVLRPGEQPSLFLVVGVGSLAYWHEVPLHVPR